ncbi:MAG TPA: phytanoyl-CoA dioxygenase family protein [Acidimicrobiales bacterium]
MKPPEIPRISRDDAVTDLADAVAETGAVIVEDLVASGDVTAILDEVRPHVEAVDPETRSKSDFLQAFYRGVRNVSGLASKSRTFVEAMLLHPVLLGAADTLLLANCDSYTLNVAQLVVRDPGSGPQLLHRDEMVWTYLPQPHADIEVAVVAALSDFTRENGATALVPGSHRWEPGRQPEPHEITHAEMPAGAGVIYLGSTIHGGGDNASDQPRPGLHMSYVVGWLRPEENNCLATPPAVARQLPRRAQELVGYATHSKHGHHGAVDLRDPIEMLAVGEL